MSTFKANITTSKRYAPHRVSHPASLFFLMLMSMVLVACGGSGNKESNTASLVVPWPQMEGDKAAQKTSASTAKSAISSITQIVITVQDNNNAELSRGTITNPGQALTINVPAGVPLSVTGVAYNKDEIVYQGRATVNPVQPSSEFQVNLILNPLWKLDIATTVDTDAKNNLGNGPSGLAMFGQDDRSLFFLSQASNLVTGDENGKADLFLKTLNTGSINNVHSNNQGGVATYAKDAIGFGDWAISSSGEFVAFVSDANNLVAGDNNQAADLFFKNTRTREVQRLMSANGALSAWSGLSMTNDGSKIAFYSAVPLIGVNDGPGMYILDVATKNPRYIGAGRAPLISGDGKTVVYKDAAKASLFLYDTTSEKIDLIDSVGNGRQIVNYAISQDNQIVVYLTATVNQDGSTAAPAVFIYNRMDDSVKLISTDTKNRPVPGSWSATAQSAPPATGSVTVQANDYSSFIINNDVLLPFVSNDGKYVIFEAGTKIYVKDTTNGVTTAIARAGANPTISPNGTYIAYTATADKRLYVEPNLLLHSPALTLVGEMLTQADKQTIALSWKPIPGAVSYNVYMGKAAVTKDNFERKFENVDIPFFAKELARQTTYFFAVTAVDGMGVETTIATPQIATSDTAPPITSQPLIPKPGTPAGLKAVPLAGAMQLDWGAVEGASGYNLYWSTRPGVGINGRRIPVNQPSFPHKELTSGTTYYYVVTAVNGGGESLPSAEVSARLPIAPPANIGATPSNNSALIQWGQVTGATTYNIYIAPNATLTADNYAQLGGYKFENVKSPFTVPQTLTNGQDYFVLIEARNELGERTFSPLTSVTPGPTAVPAKPVLKATAKQNEVELSWAPVSTAQSYNLFWSDTADAASGGTLIENVRSPFVHTGLVNGTTYFYVLTAINQVGSSPFSDQVQAVPDALISDLRFSDTNLDLCVKRAITPEVTRALQVTSLNCAKKSITNIDGLQVFPNLVTLDLDENAVSDITPLSGLTALRTLKLTANKVGDIQALAALVNLEVLTLANNGANASKSISLDPLRNLTKLTRLDAPKNGITDVTPLAGLTALVDVNLSGNQLTNISALGNLTRLNALDLSANTIADISDLANLLSLKVLRLNNNAITDISALAALTLLTDLSLNSNQISNVQPLSGSSQLKTLWLQNNEIMDISFLGGLAALTDLQLNINVIIDVTALSRLTALNKLNLNTNQLRMGVSTLAALKNVNAPTDPAIDLRANPEIPCGDVQALEAGLPDDGAAETGKVQWDPAICVITPPPPIIIGIGPFSAFDPPAACAGGRGKIDEDDDDNENCPRNRGRGPRKS